METSSVPRSETLKLHVGQPLWFRRPFYDDDETAHEHVMEHMRDLGERLLHEGDFPYEDITGQDEFPVDSSFTSRKNTATGPSGREQMDVDPEARRRMRGKTRPISPEQSTSALVNANRDAAPQEAERDQNDKRRRVDEPVSPVFTVAQDEVSTLSPVHFDSETRDDEIAVDVALPEEPTGMSGESGRGWITEEAFFTVSPGGQQMRQRKEVKMNHLSPAEKREFLKSIEVEWQTLLKNQPARVLSLEETVQARARCPDRAMDTRWVRTWKARLIIKGFTDPDLPDIESHSPTLTREGFMTVLEPVCSHGHLETRSSENNDSSSECRPMESQMNRVKFGCSFSRRSTDWPMAHGNGGTVSLLQPEVWVLRRPSWNRAFWC